MHKHKINRKRSFGTHSKHAKKAFRKSVKKKKAYHKVGGVPPKPLSV